MGAWRERRERVVYPDGTVFEMERYWDEGAEPDCERCADFGEWVGPESRVEPCPDCGDDS